MVKKILGVLFIISGVSTFLGIVSPPSDPLAGIIAIGVGIFLIYRSTKKRNNKHAIEDLNTPVVPPVKTFSFQAAGFRFDCRFPNKKFSERQAILIRSSVNDTVTLRQYEWEGKPAFALISDNLDADLGVVPAVHVNTVLKLSQEYDIHGKIISLNQIEYRGDPYTTCDIELDCYQKS